MKRTLTIVGGIAIIIIIILLLLRGCAGSPANNPTKPNCGTEVDPNATVEDFDKMSEEEIIAAAKASHAHEFIKRLPKAYDTVIGESGGSLSQGQKQLLCIARVMLTRPPMLILDEATSSIDTRTEIQVQDAFSKLMKGRTTFIVAHRLSTIREADMILVMRDGRIVEKGTHRELLKLGGFYKELYESQFAH